MKNTIHGIKLTQWAQEQAQVQKVSKLEDRSIEFILSEEQTKKKKGQEEKQTKKSLKQTCWIVTKGLVYV